MEEFINQLGQRFSGMGQVNLAGGTAMDCEEFQLRIINLGLDRSICSNAVCRISFVGASFTCDSKSRPGGGSLSH